MCDMRENKEVDKEQNTEQFILQCAEEVFLERGFDGAKTTEIAKRAGVNHAMIHYYFRTKQNLFDVVFKNKVELFASSMSNTLKRDIPLFDRIRSAIEVHFDFIAANPRLPFFLYTEIVNHDDRKRLFLSMIMEKVKDVIGGLEDSLAGEHAKGTIRKIGATELMMNIAALNITTFLAYPLMEVLIDGKEKIDRLIEERKQSNVEFVLNSIKTDSPKPKYTQATLDFGF